MNTDQQRLWDKCYRTSLRLWKGFEEFPVKLLGNERVLEIGCGDGKTISAVERENSFLVGVDFSFEALRTCRARFSGNHKLHFVQADAVSLPFRDKSFDLVISFHLFEHLKSDERQAVISEVKRILVENGIFLFRALSTHDLRYGSGKEIEKNTFLKGSGMTVHFFDENEVLELLEGMIIERLSKIDKKKRYGEAEVRRSYIEAVAKKPAQTFDSRG
ncbi:MAG: class I SAM-dependent methyltransferase [Methanomassiliicoccales archaeon]